MATSLGGQNDHLVAVETAELADVVLPSTTFVEHADVFKSYGHRHMNFVRKACEPPGEAKSNVDTFAALGRHLGLPRETWDVTEESLCRELLAASSARFTDDELEALLASGGPVKIGEAGNTGESDTGSWGTPSGRVELVSARAVAHGDHQD